MKAVNYTEFRQNRKDYMDMVCDNYDAVYVTRKNNRNIVALSEDSYNILVENMYVMSEKSNHDWLTESRKQIEEGRFHEHDLVEAENE